MDFVSIAGQTSSCNPCKLPSFLLPQYSIRMCGAKENSKVETRPELNSGAYGYEVELHFATTDTTPS